MKTYKGYKQAAQKSLSELLDGLGITATVIPCGQTVRTFSRADRREDPSLPPSLVTDQYALVLADTKGHAVMLEYCDSPRDPTNTDKQVPLLSDMLTCRVPNIFYPYTDDEYLKSQELSDLLLTHGKKYGFFAAQQLLQEIAAQYHALRQIFTADAIEEITENYTDAALRAAYNDTQEAKP